MATQAKIDNQIYNSLGDRWYTAQDDPIALLRSESKLKTPWIQSHIMKYFSSPNDVKVLDIGCGAGFISNSLAKEGFQVTGIDLSGPSLEIAKRYDTSMSVRYLEGDAYALPFEDGMFDVVTAMDFLEHVEDPQKAIAEAARVLKPGGLFFFHTFNRNILSWIVAINLVKLLIKNTPPHLHLHKMFIKPNELRGLCTNSGMSVVKMEGIKPTFSSVRPKHLLQRTVPADFEFTLTKSMAISYLGYAIKSSHGAK